MSTLPAVPEPAETVDVAQAANEFATRSKSAATWRAYRTDWRHFTEWCCARGLDPLPAEPRTVAFYISDLAATRKPSTIQRRLSSISQAHQAAGHEPPTRSAEVRFTWSGIRRTLGVAPRGVAPATTSVLRAMVDTLDTRPIGLRDRALLLVGFAGAFRRSELVSLDATDLMAVAEGLRVRLRRSKTDQEGEGTTVAIPYGSRIETCPVRAVSAWLSAAEIDAGPLFRPVTRHGRIGTQRLSDRAVAEVVKRCAERAGLDPTDFAAHSLRAGFATAAGEAGVAERHIARQTRHKSIAVLRGYIREGDVWRDNAAAEVGL